jgi:hypothetical protein
MPDSSVSGDEQAPSVKVDASASAHRVGSTALTFETFMPSGTLVPMKVDFNIRIRRSARLAICE